MYCDNSSAAVVVIQNATVLELKKAIQRHIILRQARIAGIRHISWYLSDIISNCEVVRVLPL